MAMFKIRHASIWVSGTKVAEAYKSKKSLNSGDEPQYGDEGFVGMSDGAITTTLDFDIIVPIGGATISPEQLMLNKQDVDITAGLVNGKIWQLTMRFTKAEYDSDAKAGTLMGNFSLFGGKPRIQ